MRLRVLILICLLIGNARARATSATGEGTTNTSTTTTTKSTTPTTASPIVTPTPVSTSPSINPSANAGKSSQSGGSAANMAAAAALMAACMATQPPNIALCMMGALAAMQGGADSGAADQSATTAAATNISPTSTGTSAFTIASVGSGSSGLLNPNVAAGLQAIKDAGYKVTPTAITGPDGTSTPAASFSPSSLAGTLSADQIKDANKVLAQVNADAARSGRTSLAVDGGGGGGAGSVPGGNGANEERVKLPNFKNPFALSADAQRRMVAGKTVLFDGESIGTRGGNIWDQIHEAYDKQRAGSNFIEGDVDAVSVRAPASAPHIVFPSLKKK